MPKKTHLSVDSLRYAEYYGMQAVFDELYQKSKEKQNFTDLLSLILRRENILLAYRNIKTNTGSYTAGTDKLTIYHIGQLSPEEVVDKVRYYVTGSHHGYRPKPVRRKEIPKPDGSTRPLGIPCIWDRLIQQCIKQILEPICEAKFSQNSYGFRPNRSAEHAIAKSYALLQRSHLHYVVEFDIKGFFDNVNHSKLIKQIWAMGIHDKSLIFVLKRILTAPIKMPDNTITFPQKGTPQGGIISPLLANVVLNELDHWIDSQWQQHPVVESKSKERTLKNGVTLDRSKGYQALRKTKSKEMYIVRYADDFRIFCRCREDAEKTKIAVTDWLGERLKLEISPKKTKVVNVRKRYSEFLGFKMKVHRKAKKYVVNSHICDKNLGLLKEKLVNQAKRIAKPRKGKKLLDEIGLFDEMVLGIQNYFQIATCVSLDCRDFHRAVMTILTNRLKTQKGSRLVRTGGAMTESEQKRFGKSKMVRYVSGIMRPIYPIAYLKCRVPILLHSSITHFSQEGRLKLHENLAINQFVLAQLREEKIYHRSLEFSDCRLSLFSAQKGKCAISGTEFMLGEDVLCWLKLPKHLGGREKYRNMVLVNRKYKELLETNNSEVAKSLIKEYKLSKKQITKVNKLREHANLELLENLLGDCINVN